MKIARLYSPHGGFINKEWRPHGYETGDLNGYALQLGDNKFVDMIPIGGFVLIIEDENAEPTT